MGPSVKLESPLRSYWDSRLGSRLYALILEWYGGFGDSDSAKLIRKSLDRECERDDIDANTFADFFLEILSNRSDPNSFGRTKQILEGPRRSKFFLCGREIRWGSHAFHYEDAAQFIERSLSFPIGGENVVSRVVQMIAEGKISGIDIEGRRLGSQGRPYWITDEALQTVGESDEVRNRLGLRHLNRIGQSLLEVKYPLRLSEDRAPIVIKAPTVLDAWLGGMERSWTFLKVPPASRGPEPGRTIDLSHSDGGLGCAEAVHGPVSVFAGEGQNIRLRVLDPITTKPPECSFVGILENSDL